MILSFIGLLVLFTAGIYLTADGIISLVSKPDKFNSIRIIIMGLIVLYFTNQLSPGILQ